MAIGKFYTIQLIFELLFYLNFSQNIENERWELKEKTKSALTRYKNATISFNQNKTFKLIH